MTRRFGIVTVTILQSAAMALGVPEYVYIDFSRLPDDMPTFEGLEVDEQYAEFGLWLSLDDGLGKPIIAQEGPPAVAFDGDGGGDAPMHWSGPFGLTDPPGAEGAHDAFRPIRMTFNPPVEVIQLWTAHSGGGDGPTILAYSQGSDEPVVWQSCAGSGTQEGRHRFSGSSDENPDGSPFTHLVLANPAPTQPLGYAVCSLSIARRPLRHHGPYVRVAQESVVGTGDFEQNVLGYVRPWRSPLNLVPPIADFYLYAKNFNDASNGLPREVLGLEVNRSHIAFVEASEGLSLVVVHDRPRQLCPTVNNGGGAAEVRIQFAGTTRELTNIVRDDEDDVRDEYWFAPESQEFFARSGWSANKTDGFSVSGLAGEWSAVVAFTEIDGDLNTLPIDGLSTWVVTTTDGVPISLVLQQDRRVQLTAVCLADLNGNCSVDLGDYAMFPDCMNGPNVAVASECTPFDVEVDADVDLRDFARFAAAFTGY